MWTSKRSLGASGGALHIEMGDIDLTPHIRMLWSTLDVPVAPAREPEMSHRGSSVERQKGGSKRVARWTRNGSQNGPESVDNFVKGSPGAALEATWPPEDSLRSLKGAESVVTRLRNKPAFD